MSPKSPDSCSANVLAPAALSAPPVLSQAAGSNVEGSEPKAVACCAHRTATGRRCRLRVADAQSSLCFRHLALCAAKGVQIGHQVGDLSNDLVGDLTDFQSAVNINRVLSNLLLLVSRDRISPRRASVVAYTCSLLLHSLPHIGRELHSPEAEAEETAEFVRAYLSNMPRPDYEKRTSEVPQRT